MWSKEGELKELLNTCDELYEDYKNGKTLKEISKKYQIPLKDLKYVLIGKKYSEGASAAELAAEFKISVRTIHDQLDVLGLVKHRKEKGTHKSPAERKIREKEVAALTDEAEKIATIAIGIGGVIARGYLPLINHLMKSGRTLEMIATDVMQWFEMKIPTETRITELEVNIETLRRQVSEAWAIAVPNFRYMLRARLVTDFAKRVLVARMNGLRIPVRSTIRAFQNELAQVDKDLEQLMEKQ